MELLEKKLEELRERLPKECENFEVFKHEGEVYVRYVCYHKFQFLKVYNLGEGIQMSLPVTEPGKVLRLTKESLSGFNILEV